MQQSFVRVGLQRCNATATRSVVGRDDDLGVRSVDPGGKGVRGEPGKYDGVDGADAGASEHGVGSFRDHRQINHHTIAFVHTQLFENVGHLADLAVQLGVCDVQSGILGIIRFPDDGGLIAARFQMAVDAIGRDVQHTVFEPFDGHISGRKADVFDLRIGFDPIDAFALLTPEGDRIRDRSGVDFLILLSIHVRWREPLWRLWSLCSPPKAMTRKWSDPWLSALRSIS